MMVAEYPIQVRANSFTTAIQVPTGSRSLPTSPSVAQDGSGKIWLAYENKTVGSQSNSEIFLKTLSGTTWSSGQQVTLDPADSDATPFVASLSNGSMMIAWSSNRTGNNQFQLFYKLYASTTVKPTTKSIRLTQSTLNDTQPSIVQDRNGRIWVAWARQNQTSISGGVVYYSDIFYKYFNGSSWSNDFALPQDSLTPRQQEITPYITQSKDGRIWIAWASNETSDGTFDLWYKTTDATIYSLPSTGTISWSARTAICCLDTNADDTHPAIVQDRNGTITTFWDRCAGVLLGCTDDIFYSNSLNNGLTWTTLTALPAAPTTNAEASPTVARMSDRTVKVFWQKTATLSTEIWYTTSDQVLNIHDVGIASMATSSRFIRSGLQWDNSGIMNINVTVRNYGDFAENTTLTIKLNNTILATILVVNLSINQTRLFQTSWQSPLGFWGRYSILATVQPVPTENTINQADNNWSGGPIRVSPPGDVDFNGCVNILDAALLAYSYGSSQGPPPSPLWNPNADVDHSGKIDILDAAQLAFYFGDCV